MSFREMIILLAILTLPGSAYAQSKDTHPWLEAVNTTLISVFNDVENQRITNEVIDKNLNNNPQRVDEFEFYRRSAEFGQADQFRSLVQSFSEREINKVKMFRSWQGGLRFNIGEEKKPAKEKLTVPKIRYGLKLVSIESNPDQKLLLAANNPGDFEHILIAPKAKINWTIAKVEINQQPVRPYRAILDSPPLERSYWDQFLSKKISGKLVPDPSTNFAKLKGLPPQILTLHQVDGVYALEVKTDDQLAPQTFRHIFQMAFDQFRVLNERNKELDATKYSLSHRSETLPLTSLIHYLPLEEKYIAEVSYRYGTIDWRIAGHLASPKLLEPFSNESGNVYEFKLNMGI